MALHTPDHHPNQPPNQPLSEVNFALFKDSLISFLTRAKQTGDYGSDQLLPSENAIYGAGRARVHPVCITISFDLLIIVRPFH